MQYSNLCLRSSHWTNVILQTASFTIPLEIHNPSTPAHISQQCSWLYIWKFQNHVPDSGVSHTFLNTKINHLPYWLESVAVTWQTERRGSGASAHCWQWLVATAQTWDHADTSQGTIWRSALCFLTPQQLDGSCSLVKNAHPPTVTFKWQRDTWQNGIPLSRINTNLSSATHKHGDCFVPIYKEMVIRVQNRLFVPTVQSPIFNHNSNTQLNDTSCQVESLSILQ